MRKSSIASALNFIGRAAKQQLTPSSKSKKNIERQTRRQRTRESFSSSAYSRNSFSDVSGSEFSHSVESQFTPSSERKGRRRQSALDSQSNSRSNTISRGSRSRHRSDGRGSPKRNRSRSHSESSEGHKKRHHYRIRRRHNANRHDDAAQMINLLMRLLPFYGTGDINLDSLVIDTIHRLPPDALEMHDASGSTLLLSVCQFKTYALLPILLSKGCNVNVCNNVGATPLHFTCFSDTFSPDSAIALIRHGAFAEVIEQDWGCTPLHWAGYSGHIELCRMLCIAGANPTTLDKNGKDPIAYSHQSGNPACTLLLESFRRDDRGAKCSLKWERILDKNTGSSFYHNKETGESLWGDDFRRVNDADKAVLKEKPTAEKCTSELQTINITGKDEIIPSQTKHNNASANTFENNLESHSVTKRLPLNMKEQTNMKGIPRLIKNDCNIEALAQMSAENMMSELESSCRIGIEEAKELHIDAKTEGDSHCPSSLINPDLSPSDKGRKDRLKYSTPVRENNNVFQNRLDDIVEVESFGSIKMVGTKRSNLSVGSKDETLLGKRYESEEETVGATFGPSNRGNGNFTISVEERISILHEKMEHQLMDRLNTLEEKIIQKNLIVPDKSTQQKEQLSEMSCTILQLRTEIATKELEILSLKQKNTRLETSIEEHSTKLTADAFVGEGELDIDSTPTVKDPDLLLQKTQLEQVLKDAFHQIASLQIQSQETDKLVSDIQKQLNETKQLLASTEQSLADEKVSHSSVMLLLEQAQKGQRVDSNFTLTLKEEKQRAEEASSLLKDQLCIAQEIARDEANCLQDRIDVLERSLNLEKAQVTALDDNLRNTIASHRASLIELKCQHDKEIEQTKTELRRISIVELKEVQDQLKKELVSKMELELAKNEAVIAFECALEKAKVAERSLEEMVKQISETQNLKKANEQLHTSLQEETEKRKVLHNTLEDIKGKIRVYVRIRPLSSTEVAANYINVMMKENNQTLVMASDPATNTDVREWEFDKIFSGNEDDGNSQEAIFQDTNLLLTSAIDGYNVCIFAYGQTGSGKTYTMFGGDSEKHKGLAPRIASELFKKLQEREMNYHVEVSVSMIELYTDKLNDLLGSKDREDESTVDLKIHLAEHTSSGLVEVEGIKMERVMNGSELLDVFNHGVKSRVCSSTKLNSDSSRSHMIASVVMSLRNKRNGKVVHGKLTLVDLAGSERVGKSGVAGQQLKEAQSINKSLSALGDVIGALTSGDRQHIPYRNHPLTMLMSDSIGGNAKTLMFVCCSPADYNRKETANSLDFARRCRNVINNINNTRANKKTSTSNMDQIKALRAELSRIKEKSKGSEAIPINGRSSSRKGPGM